MRTLSLIIVLFYSINALSQENVLSLEQVIDSALQNNQSLKAASFDVESQKQRKKTSFDLPKTNVSLLYGQYNSNARNDNNITISQAIPFTAFGSQSKFNRSSLASSELRKSVTVNDLIYQVKHTYYLLAFTLERKNLLLSQDSIYEGFFKSASLRYKTGESNLLEYTTAETKRNEIKNQLRRIESEIINLETELKTLMNSEASPKISSKVFSAIEINTALDTSLNSRNPSLAYTRQLIEVAHAEKKVESAKAAPELLIGFFTQTLIGSPYGDGTIASSSDRFTGFQVGMSIPLWFVPHQGRVKAAAFNMQAAQSNYEQSQIAVRGQYQQAIQVYENNRNSLAYYKTSALPNVDLILKQANAAFKGGDISYADFLLSLRSAINIKEEYLQTLNDYNQSVIYIQYLMGNN